MSEEKAKKENKVTTPTEAVKAYLFEIASSINSATSANDFEAIEKGISAFEELISFITNEGTETISAINKMAADRKKKVHFLGKDASFADQLLNYRKTAEKVAPPADPATKSNASANATRSAAVPATSVAAPSTDPKHEGESVKLSIFDILKGVGKEAVNPGSKESGEKK